MTRLRFWTTILIIWLIFLFNIERINAPVNIRAYTYIFVALVVMITLMLPQLRWLPYWSLMLLSILAFLFYKAFWSNHLIWGPALPLTVTQVSAIILTGLIARQINSGLREFESVITNITFGQIGNLPKPFSEMQKAMYQEVRRARRFQRPLSVMALKIDEQSIQVALPQTIKTVQQAMMREYVFAKVSRILDTNVDDFGTISLRDNHFILVLPEKTAHDAHLLGQDLKKAIEQEIKIELQLGTASFPEEAITFEALIEQAVKNTGQKTINQQSLADQAQQETMPQEG